MGFIRKKRRDIVSIFFVIAFVLCLAFALVVRFNGLKTTLTDSAFDAVTVGESVGENEFVSATVESVVDGDTIWVFCDGARQKVRLIGVDTPESVNPDQSKNTEGGIKASSFVKSIVFEGSEVWLQVDKSNTDKFGRQLRYVWLVYPDNPTDVEEVRTKMLNGIVVSQGFAIAKRYEPDTAYADMFETLENQARLGNVNLWSTDELQL